MPWYEIKVTMKDGPSKTCSAVIESDIPFITEYIIEERMSEKGLILIESDVSLHYIPKEQICFIVLSARPDFKPDGLSY